MPLTLSPATIKIAEFAPLAATAASLSFSGIRGDLRSLRLEVVGRGDTAANSTTVGMRLNGDSGSNYDRESVSTLQSTSTPAETLGAASLTVGTIAAANAAANYAGVIIIEIPLYAGAFVKNILARASLHVSTASGGISSSFIVGRWRNSAAITSITLFPAAGNFDVGSFCCLWGVV